MGLVDLDRDSLDPAHGVVDALVGEQLTRLEHLFLEEGLGVCPDRPGVRAAALAKYQRERDLFSDLISLTGPALQQRGDPLQLRAGDAREVVDLEMPKQNGIAGSQTRADRVGEERLACPWVHRRT